MNWMLFWKIVLILALTAYSLLALIVTVGGARNIVQMLKELKEPSADREEETG